MCLYHETATSTWPWENSWVPMQLWELTEVEPTDPKQIANRIGERPVRVVRPPQHTSRKKVFTLFSAYEWWWETVSTLKNGTSEDTRKFCPATALSSLQQWISKLKFHLIKIDPRSPASCPYLTPLFIRWWNKKYCRSTGRGMRTISTYRRIGLPHKSPS